MTKRVHLTDRDIERLVQARSSARDWRLLEDILAATRGMPQERPRSALIPQSRRMTILWAAVLVTALMVGLTVAVGSGLLPLPWPTDGEDTDFGPLAGPITNCHRPLPDGVVLTVVHFQDAWQLTVYEDGRVLKGHPVGWGVGTENSLEGTWQQRRLTMTGADNLVGAIRSALPDCRQIEADGIIDIQARVGGAPYAVRIGQDVIETRVTTAAESAAAQEIAQALDAQDLGLARGDWTDSSWSPYMPVRWQVWLRFMPSDDPGWASGDTVVLPGEASLSTFGSEAEEGEPGGVGRCAVVGFEGAREIARILTDAGGRPPPELGPPDGHWFFTVGDSEAVQVSVVGLLPHEPDCVSASNALPTPTPAPAPSLAPGDVAPLASACDYLPASAIRTEGREDRPGWSEDWSFCWYPLTDEGLYIASARRPTPAARAAEQAASLFGEEGLTADQVGGHDVFLNGCARSGEQCRAALALSVEPHFVVVVWRAGEADMLRRVAELIVENLDQPQ
jgi:hypothetical protein